MTLKESKIIFLELTRSDYLYLRKIFYDNSSYKSSFASKKYKYSQTIKDRLANMDHSANIPRLFALLVIENEILREDQFQRLIFDRPELDIQVSHQHSLKTGGFKFLSDRIHKRLKMGKFQLDYVVPNLWGDSSTMITVQENDHDLLHSVAVPQLDKV